MNDAGRPGIAVIGAGSWGTALAIHLARTGHTVRLWGRDPEVVLEIERARRNGRYLPDVDIPQQVMPTTDLRWVLSGSSYVVFALPSGAVTPDTGAAFVLRRPPCCWMR